jgi:peptidoglycan hydrolase CwlO-like protein
MAMANQRDERRESSVRSKSQELHDIRRELESADEEIEKLRGKFRDEIRRSTSLNSESRERAAPSETVMRRLTC